MNVVDSSGWIEYFTKDTNAQFFIPPIQDLGNLLVPTICVYEVFKRLLLERGEESALQAAGVMSHGREIDLNRKIALEAARRPLGCHLTRSTFYRPLARSRVRHVISSWPSGRGQRRADPAHQRWRTGE